MEIDIHQYLAHEQMCQIAQDEFRKMVQQQTTADFERILSNAGHYFVEAEVNAAFDGNMRNIVRDKAIKVINTMSLLTVFSPPNAWDREASEGWKVLQAALKDAKPEILERLRGVISLISATELRELIETSVADVIVERLTGKTTP